MSFFRQHRFLLSVMLLLAAVSVVVVQRHHATQTQHVEIREAFILLHTRGYTNQADRLYRKLLSDLPTLSNKQLVDDFQRTLLLVDPGATNQYENILWKYHWTVSNEMDRRAESSLTRARKLADEQK